jgi:methionyl aminopeptidase
MRGESEVVVRGSEVVVRRRGIILKSPREIELMRDAGRVVREVLESVRRATRPGVTTGELNAVAENLIAQAGGIALFKGQRCPTAKLPFPAALCTSVNEELVHGIPGDRALQEGDIVSVDCGVKLSGYCGDAALTIPVGRVSPEVQTLLDVTRQALELAIAGIRPGRMWSEVARAIQSFVEGHRLAVVREFVGHGIGREMHEEPKVPNYWAREQESFDFALVPNLVIAVEPMVNLGTRLVEIGDDTGWVIVTKDRKYAAHFEHTVAVTEDGVDVLTDGR